VRLVVASQQLLLVAPGTRYPNGADPHDLTLSCDERRALRSALPDKLKGKERHALMGQHRPRPSSESSESARALAILTVALPGVKKPSAPIKDPIGVAFHMDAAPWDGLSPTSVVFEACSV